MATWRFTLGFPFAKVSVRKGCNCCIPSGDLNLASGQGLSFYVGFAPRARDASVRAPLDHCDHTRFLVHGPSGGLASERACLPRPAERRGFIRPRVFLVAPRSALRPEVLVQDLAGTVAGHPSNPWPCDRSRCSSHNPSASAVSLEPWQSPQSTSPPITGIPRTRGSAAHNARPARAPAPETGDIGGTALPAVI